MTSTGHTYGPSCLLHEESNTFTRRASQVPMGPPHIKAQFFYCSSLPIDDPLSPVPPPPSGSTKPAKVPPRPFSIHDNRALEEAWLGLHKPEHLKDRGNKRSNGVHEKEEGTEETPSRNIDNLTKVVKESHDKKCIKKEQSVDVTDISDNGLPAAAIEQPTQPGSQDEGRGRKLYDHIDRIASKQPKSIAGQDSRSVLALCDDSDSVLFDETMPVRSAEIGNDESESGFKTKRSFSPFRRKNKAERKPQQKDDRIPDQWLSPAQKTQDTLLLGSSPSERDTTGTPFLRVPSRLRRGRSRSRSPDHQSQMQSIAETDAAVDGGPDSASRPPSRPMFQRFKSGHSREASQERDEEGHMWRLKRKRLEESKVVVGVLRLHIVEMANLKMGPIYWDPIHDVSSVVRGTWFYKETMWPVESDLANQLEEGYEYIKPWTPTYIDELNSCQDIGPDAELKVVHRIWPSDDSGQESSRPATGKDKNALLNTADSQLSANETKRKDAIGKADKPENRAAGVLDGFDDPVRLFANSSIIYADAHEAQILQPSQLPSAARGRRPLAKIRKGQAVGVTVVRGFDLKRWEIIHPPKKAASTKTTKETYEGMLAVSNMNNGQQKTCPACLSANNLPKVTDLVLVIHGIGQKLSERVESFHFTHAINAFRRQLNIELQADAVKPLLRPELGCIMVLPVNWRSKVKLQDAFPKPTSSESNADPTGNHYTLKDITADSIPAVRNMISDVMLDIPYYLSHHKATMIEGVIKEANRIYRVWCNNNPGFSETGRVHLMTHSLGSMMALDILSNQPTKLPRQLDLKATRVRTDILEFDTKSLFFCGSPAGFFLLLNRVPLLPRKGRNKPGAESEDKTAGVAGGPGTYGCLAVDNLYNIFHQYDPIAYCLNGTVDVAYANSLQPAFVPSATGSWAQYFGSMFKGKNAAPTKALTCLEQFPQRSSIAQMPSTVEMETHNFSREEIAEKRFYLLNDNGQIDYTLKPGGGPLEIQYLNMLSAHSSYWTSRDFVRFLVVEIGRKPGKDETLHSIKAVKKAWGKR